MANPLASSGAPPAVVTRRRVVAIDWMRGIVMVLMALDHSSGEFNAGRLFTAHALGVAHTLGLGATYGFAALVIAVLYPVCRVYRRYKEAHPDGWTRYV